MKIITTGTLSALLLAICLLPGVAAARQGFSQINYFDSLYSANPGTHSAATLVPEPRSTQVQVHIFKKATVLWPQVIPGLPPGALPVTGKILIKDPQVAKLIQKYAKQHAVDPKLVQAMIRQESGFNPMAVSPKGAMGLMQLMPETAASLGVEDPFDIEQNIKGGIRFLKICLKKFDKNLPLALAAYNAGPGRVVEHQGMPPFKETHTYVKKIVQDYCGQTIDPAQIKVGQAAEPQKDLNQPENAAQFQVQPAAPPLDLTSFTHSAPERVGALIFSEKSPPDKNAPASTQ
jgi:hypothetical protein